MMRPPILVVWLLALAVVAGTATGFRWRTPRLDVMFDTDEADYARALAYGIKANYLGTEERSGIGFARDVFEEYRRTGWARPFKADWDTGDAAGLRHYHPPLAFYPAAALADAGIRDERTIRIVPLATGVLACIGAALLAFVLLGGTDDRLRVMLATAAGLVTAASPYHVLSSAVLGAHAAFSLLSVIVLAALARAMIGSSTRWWLAACVLFGMAVLTVPYWALLLLPLGGGWMLMRRERSRHTRDLMWGVIAALTATLVLWPPFLLDAALVKPALMFGSLIASAPDVGQAPGAWVVDMLLAHPALVLLGMLAPVAAWFMDRSRWRVAAPPVVFVVSFIVLNLRVSYMKPLYVADIIPALAAVAAALAGWSIAKLNVPIRVAAAALLSSLAVTVALASSDPAPAPGEWRATLADLNGRFDGKQVLVTPREVGPMMTYYLDRAAIVLDSDHPDDVDDLRQRLAAGDIDIVLKWGSLVDPNGVAREAIPERPPDGTGVAAGTNIAWWTVDEVPAADLGSR